jgi:hypothetical protein
MKVVFCFLVFLEIRKCVLIFSGFEKGCSSDG